MPQASGINVTPAVAMTFSAVFAAHKILSESTAMLPLFLMRRTSSGKSPATDQSLYGVLHDVANPEMDAYLVRETMTASMVGRGFAVGIVDYDTDGAITALWPVPPGRAEPSAGCREEPDLQDHHAGWSDENLPQMADPAPARHEPGWYQFLFADHLAAPGYRPGPSRRDIRRQLLWQRSSSPGSLAEAERETGAQRGICPAPDQLLE